MKIILETSRLILREKTTADIGNMIALNNNPLVIQYTGDTAFANEQEARLVLDSLLWQYRHYGYARWAVDLKNNGEFIGWCGLKYHPEEQKTDIGYRLFQKHWNKGYATEAAAACIEYGFSHFKLKCIEGHAMKANAASIRVFEKLGMRPIDGADSHCADGVVYLAEPRNPERRIS